MASQIPNLQHRDHQKWLSKIDFYQDQIKIFQKELTMVLKEHPDLFSIIEHVDEYRDILMKKLGKLDEMRLQIVLHEKQIAEDFNTGGITIWDHYEIRKYIEEFERAYNDLKQNFRKFVAHQI